MMPVTPAIRNVPFKLTVCGCKTINIDIDINKKIKHLYNYICEQLLNELNLDLHLYKITLYTYNMIQVKYDSNLPFSKSCDSTDNPAFYFSVVYINN